MCGYVFELSDVECGESMSCIVIGDFELCVESVILVSGGIGGNYDFVCKYWFVDCFGKLLSKMVLGVFDYVDGLMYGVVEVSGVVFINIDCMWYYCEGIINWLLIWLNYGICILFGLLFLWFDVFGECMELFCFFGFDMLGMLCCIFLMGYEYSWFVLM